MMTRMEMVAVLREAEKGRRIEFREHSDDEIYWNHTSKPLWNFNEADYRAEPWPDCEPYDKDTFPEAKYFTINGKMATKYLPLRISHIGVTYLNDNTSRTFSFYDFLSFCTWIDGSPCGRPVNE